MLIPVRKNTQKLVTMKLIFIRTFRCIGRYFSQLFANSIPHIDYPQISMMMSLSDFLMAIPLNTTPQSIKMSGSTKQITSYYAGESWYHGVYAKHIFLF